jgi:hypothetical protein
MTAPFHAPLIATTIPGAMMAALSFVESAGFQSTGLRPMSLAMLHAYL